MSLADKCIVVGCFVCYDKILMETAKFSDNTRVTDGLVSALVVEFCVDGRRRSTWSTPKECQLWRQRSRINDYVENYMLCFYEFQQPVPIIMINNDQIGRIDSPNKKYTKNSRKYNDLNSLLVCAIIITV